MERNIVEKARCQHCKSVMWSQVINLNELNINKHRIKLEVLLIPHYAYTSPLAVVLTRPEICLHLNM